MLCMPSIIYLFVLFDVDYSTTLPFVYLSSAEPMPLGLVVIGGTSFFLVPILRSPRLLRRVAPVYVVPTHNEESAGGTTGILPSSFCVSEQVTMLWEGGEAGSDPIWLHRILYFSDFSDFSDFGYKFRGTPNLYYL